MWPSREMFSPMGNISLGSSKTVYMFLQCVITRSLKLREIWRWWFDFIDA